MALLGSWYNWANSSTKCDGESKDVVGPLAERRNRQSDDVDAKVQVLSKQPVAHHAGQVAVRRRDDPHVDGDRFDAAQGHDGPFLNATQQLGLRRQRQFADFIQEQGPAVGTPHHAQRGAHRAGKCSFDVTEQLRFDQLAGKRRAVHRHERFAGPQAAGVDLASGHLLADARLTFDQHRGRAGSDAVDLRPQRVGRFTFAQQPAAVGCRLGGQSRGSPIRVMHEKVRL